MTASPHLMVVDDDDEIRSLLGDFLRRHGFRADTAADGRAMRRLLEVGAYDLIVLDLMLPGEDGLALCRQLRATSDVPVIMLTALNEETERIVGLEMGADDYLAKPFSPHELLARVKAVLRRPRDSTARGPGAGQVLRFEGWCLHVGRRELHAANGTLLPLTSGEFDLLVALAQRPQRVLSRDNLLDLTRGRATAAFDRAVDVQLSRLRRKIEADPSAPKLIKTVRGGGYMFATEVEETDR